MYLLDVTKVKGNKLEMSHLIVSVAVLQRPQNHIAQAPSMESEFIDPEECEAVNLLEDLHDGKTIQLPE